MQKKAPITWDPTDTNACRTRLNSLNGKPCLVKNSPNLKQIEDQRYTRPQQDEADKKRNDHVYGTHEIDPPRKSTRNSDRQPERQRTRIRRQTLSPARA